MEKIILFDLDSTLLQMDQDLFIKEYFNLVGKYIHSLGMDSSSFMKAFSYSAFKILENDGTKTNEKLFWDTLSKFGYSENLKDVFSSFYQNEFSALEKIVHKTDIPRRIIDTLRSKGYIIILATNPLFPRECTYRRIEWAGLKYTDFDYITTYENCTFCKPNSFYYKEIFSKLGKELDGSIMVGNDMWDDFSDIPQGINKILITDYMINSNNVEVDIPKFTLRGFLEYIEENYE